MSTLYNLARMTTATVGTGTITLGSAVAPWLTFALAGVANGDIVAYAIKDGVANSEIGFGTYTSAGTTLTRTVTKSTNSNNAISLSGSAEVYIAERAEDIVTSPNCGRLTFSNATNIIFVPFNGSQIKIAGSLYQLPSAGVGSANTSVTINGTGGSNLAASTDYLATLFLSSGTLTFDFLTTLTHAVDTTSGNIGTEIKSGDNTRSVIGLIRTNASSQFSEFLTLSWFNRRRKTNSVVVTSNTAITGTTAFTEFSSSFRNTFICWNDDTIIFSINGGFFQGILATVSYIALGIDGSTPEDTGTSIMNGSTAVGPAAITAAKFGLANGNHFATIVGAESNSADTLTLTGGATSGKRSAINVIVMG